MNANVQKSSAGDRWGPWVYRSLLYMPVNEERFLAKAHTRGADAIILDLEDSVALQEKAAARKLLPAAAKRLADKGIDVVARVNSPIRLCIPDLEEVVGPHVKGIWLPKCRSVDHVQMIAETIAELEAERGMEVGSTWMAARIETAQSFLRIGEISAAHPRVRAVGLGGEDFSLSIGVEPSQDTLIYPKQQAIIAAYAAGVAPLGLVSSSADFSDLDTMRQVVRQSRRFGFIGASCIHPAVVPILNEGFRPTPDEVERAQRVSSAFYAAVKEGKASIQVDGKMVDYPVAYRADRVLERDALIRAKESKTGRG
ncbi:MAG: HpcH/HpaI aldolase/citrate lyase family protein [Alphaproteobacteria bacterium]